MPDAILLSWQAGQEGGNSIADILTGHANPSGKLPMTFPVTLSDHWSTLNFPVDQKIDRRWSVKTGLTHAIKNVDYTVYDEGIYVGYRWFDTRNLQVSYPFGYGLSYTTFEYGKPSVKRDSDKVIVEVAIKTPGKLPEKRRFSSMSKYLPANWTSRFTSSKHSAKPNCCNPVRASS